MHLSRDHVLQALRAPAVVHRYDVDLGDRLQQFAEQRQRRSRTGRRERNLARIVLGVFDQVGHRVHRQRRIDHQHQRVARHQRHHRQVLQRIVGELLIERRVDRERAARREQQRVTVRRGLRDGRGRCRGAGARAVLHDEGLAEPLGELLRHQPADDINRSTCGERHYDGDLARRIVLRGDWTRNRERWRRRRSIGRCARRPPSTGSYGIVGRARLVPMLHQFWRWEVGSAVRPRRLAGSCQLHALADGLLRLRGRLAGRLRGDFGRTLVGVLAAVLVAGLAASLRPPAWLPSRRPWAAGFLPFSAAMILILPSLITASSCPAQPMPACTISRRRASDLPPSPRRASAIPSTPPQPCIGGLRCQLGSLALGAVFRDLDGAASGTRPRSPAYRGSARAPAGAYLRSSR